MALPALLPPPSSYATLYASYQHEWDAHKHTVPPTRSSHNVTALTWVTADDEHEDEDTTHFLLVCTDAGEVVTLRLVPNTAPAATTTTSTITSTSSSDSSDSTPPFVLVPHGRAQICGAAVDATEEETTTATPGAFNNKMEIVSLRVHDQKKERKFVLLAGDRGLWSLPLSALLTGDTTTTTTADAAIVRNTKVVQISDRPIAQVQIVAVSNSETKTATTTSKKKKKKQNSDDDQYLLYALEQGTNRVLTWNLHTLVQQHHSRDTGKGKHRTNSHRAFLVPEQQLDIARYLSTNRKRTRTRTQGRTSTGECATTMVLVPPSVAVSETAGVEDDAAPSNWSLVVGTDRARLLIVTVKKTEDGTLLLEEPRFLALDEPDGATNKVSTRFLSLEDQDCSTNANTSSRPTATWEVRDLVVHEPWWTIAAHRRHHEITSGSSSSIPSRMTGLLMTWHGPTGMIMSRRETREAIQGLQSQQQQPPLPNEAACSRLYSLANEAAVSLWNPLDFEDAQKFKVTTPSSTALAVCGPYVAVAGIGNSIDVFLQQCRVQLLRV